MLEFVTSRQGFDVGTFQTADGGKRLLAIVVFDVYYLRRSSVYK